MGSINGYALHFGEYVIVIGFWFPIILLFFAITSYFNPMSVILGKLIAAIGILIVAHCIYGISLQ